MTPIAPAATAVQAASAPARARPAATFGAALRAQAPPAPASRPSAPAAARAALETVERARQRLDAALAAARRGQTFSAQELLALQADAYRYSQTFEVASRLVEHATQSVKQAVNTQL